MPEVKRIPAGVRRNGKREVRSNCLLSFQGKRRKKRKRKKDTVF